MARAEASVDRFCTATSGIQLTFTRKGLEVSGYYDHIVGIEGGLVPWDEIDLARRTVFEKTTRSRWDASVDPYATEVHQRWVDQEMCPSINRSKTWCNRSKGHSGDHAAPFELANGQQTEVFWTDADEYTSRRKA